jgi:hypothetical protein
MKGLLVDVFGSNCNNYGVTYKKELAILCGAGFAEIFESNSERPALVIRPGRGGREFIAVPTEASEDVYPMFGGNFVYSSDARFPSDQPIHVHDRFELSILDSGIDHQGIKENSFIVDAGDNGTRIYQRG